MGIVEDLERLKKLKDNGVITEAEFESEKQRILNSNSINETKKGIKIFFSLTGVYIILTIICIGLWMYNNHCWYEIFDSNGYDDARLFREDYKEYAIKYEEYQQELDKSSDRMDLFQILAFVTGGLSVIFLIIGIALKVKEKRNTKMHV